MTGLLEKIFLCFTPHPVPFGGNFRSALLLWMEAAHSGCCVCAGSLAARVQGTNFGVFLCYLEALPPPSLPPTLLPPAPGPHVPSWNHSSPKQGPLVCPARCRGHAGPWLIVCVEHPNCVHGSVQYQSRGCRGSICLYKASVQVHWSLLGWKELLQKPHPHCPPCTPNVSAAAVSSNVMFSL